MIKLLTNKDFTDNGIKLSIIMPLYNAEDTLRLALDSIFMQRVDFTYEVIAIDDASSDKTADILQEYADKYKVLKIITHDKNQGNAISFYDALCISRGDYMCVLDGDDYYTVKNKLQKQVDFLDRDVNKKYVAVSHKYLQVNADWNIFDNNNLFYGEKDYKYADFLTQCFYSHTATYMYRNIFKDNVPDILKEPMYRGDNPRTFLHMFFTRGLIKNLNFVGSVYFYNNKGLWSKESVETQKTRNIIMMNTLAQNFKSDIEKKLWCGTGNIDNNNLYEQWVICNSSNEYQTPDYILDKAKNIASTYAFKNMDFVFQSLYKSEFLDSLCESIGFIELVKRGFRPGVTRKKNENNICIIIANLTTTGGGVYYEIKDIISMYADKNVYILLTDVDSEQNLDKNVYEDLKQFSNLTNVYGQEDNTDKLQILVNKILEINPAKIYPYCGHNNVYANSLIQSILGKNICVFSFDHGFSLGLDNSNYDTYIAKRPSDYEILSNYYHDKVIFIPCWNKDKKGNNKYVPFNQHSELITACAAARYYKLGKDYIDIIFTLLEKTGGKHIHYGPISEADLQKIYIKMDRIGMPHDRFINIPWAENLPKSMSDNNVDIFIEPFPTISYKITLDVLSAGIPVVSRHGQTRMSLNDFIYDGALFWKNVDDFVDLMTNLTIDSLQKHSKLSIKYYQENHSISVLQKFFCSEKMFTKPSIKAYYDKFIADVTSVEQILTMDKTPYQKRKKIKLVENMRLQKRLKEFVFGLLLAIAQIPVLDLLIRSKKRKKLLKQIIKYYR